MQTAAASTVHSQSSLDGNDEVLVDRTGKGLTITGSDVEMVVETSES